MTTKADITQLFEPITNKINGASYVCLNINPSNLTSGEVIQPYVTPQNRGGQPAMFVKIFGLEEYVKANGGSNYVLPIASSTVLGGIKVGSGLSIDVDGVLSATGGGGTVTSVSGTLNRITSTGGTTPIIDIDSAYDALWQPKTANLTSLSGLTFASTSFVKMTSAGTFALDTNTYITGNQTITLSGEASGSGTTGISVTLANSAVIGKVLTGYVSGAGIVVATDTILQAIQKLNGNIGAIVSGVSSVSGTTNRITVSPTSGAVIVDISASYVGQTSIITLGTIGTGTWQATKVAIAYGGTNSSTALSNNRIMISSGGAIVEQSAITASRIIVSDSSGLPIAADTATYPSLTELSYLKGVNRALQTQINELLTGSITISTSTSIDTSTLNSGSLGQSGRNVIISNGANAINVTCLSSSDAEFYAAYFKLGTSAITFVAGSGITLVTVDGTAVLNGAVGSTATLIRTDSTHYYLRISNA